MTLEHFLHGASPEARKELTFHLLDEPIVVEPYCRGKHTVFALANGRWLEEDNVQYTFALAFVKVMGKHEIRVLCIGPHQGLDVADVMKKDAWGEKSKYFFYPWVQEWLKSNPAKLVVAGVIIGKFQAKQQ